MFYCMGRRGWMERINRGPDGSIDGWQVKGVCMQVCVCVCVWKGWNWITLGLGREHGSGYLIDRSHCESTGSNVAGQGRDKHNQHSLTHTKTNHRECNRRWGRIFMDVSLPGVLHALYALSGGFGKVKVNFHSKPLLKLFSPLCWSKKWPFR